jgi:TM2 domain-containing membrane protein YozV
MACAAIKRRDEWQDFCSPVEQLFIWQHHQLEPERKTMATATLPVNDTHMKTVGYLVWLFGFTGSHRFYYGKQITGTIWFFTLGLLGIGWLIDLFLIPSMDRQADRRYLAGSYDYTIAWILLTFLGLFGVHRFYLGKWVTGIIYLFTGGLLGLGWLYDLWTLNEQVSAKNIESTVR